MSRNMNVTEAAERLGVSESYVRHLVCSKGIPFYKVGSRVLFAEKDLVNWLEARRVPSIASNAGKGQG